jgi:hypothetical protein
MIKYNKHFALLSDVGDRFKKAIRFIFALMKFRVNLMENP